MKAQLKLHKPHIPRRPVINNTQAPTYKIAKHLTKIFDNFLNLNNHYNVSKSTDLATALVKLNVNENHRLITFDIMDLFLNIPKPKTLQITKSLLLKNNTPDVTQQITKILELILSQNYFTFQNKLYQPKKHIHGFTYIQYNCCKILQHLVEKNIKKTPGL
jgi:hypothetical protein